MDIENSLLDIRSFFIHYLFRPFRASILPFTSYLGRCPRLLYFSPFWEIISSIICFTFHIGHLASHIPNHVSRILIQSPNPHFLRGNRSMPYNFNIFTTLSCIITIPVLLYMPCSICCNLDFLILSV
jgi:hypothetical protein